MELEGLSHEDREFEVARRVVRLGAAAARRAAHTPKIAPPQVIARKALKAAARVHAPGLVRGRHHHGCRHCAAKRRGYYYGRKRHYASGGGGVAAPTYVRRTNGTTTRVVGAPIPTTTVGYSEPSTVYTDPDYTEPVEYPVAMRGGRWFRRGRHIILTGV
jgi:hypothetical protein